MRSTDNQQRHGFVRGVALIAFALGLARSARAQQPPREIVVRVYVVDSTRAPIGGAEVSLVRDVNTQLASVVTDGFGMSELRAPRDDGAYQIVVRRIGYQRNERFFARPMSDTVALQIVLSRVVQELAPVKVTENENRTARHYHLDADEIANETRPLFDATDVLTKIRPEMLGNSDCALQNVWVNGTRIVFPPPNEMALMRRGQPPPPAPPPKLVFQGDGSSGRALPSSPAQRVPEDPWSTLASIKPEHILEINYIDCFIYDPVHKKGSDNAVYIALKPGIAYEPGKGSFVVDTARTDEANALPPVRMAALPDSVLAYRRRLLGVYDESTGEPIKGVEVIDGRTGLRARTTVTGTVSLLYLDEGENHIRIHRDGYRDEEMDVTIGPSHKNPITVVLVRAP
jgi:hypothetical protein